MTLATPALAGRTIAIPFAAEIGSTPSSCETTVPGPGSTATEVRATDFRLFVSNAALIPADGTLQAIAPDQDGIWQPGGLALLDFEDATGACANGTAGTNTTLRDTVPEGDHTGLSLTVGMPFAQNHQDPTLAAAPRNVTAMCRNRQGGHKFVRIDMVPTALAVVTSTEGNADAGVGHASAQGWLLHLGSTMCEAASKTDAPTSCANPNRIPVILDGFDPAGNTVVIDPAPVVAGADLMANAPDTSPGCMSVPKDADCMTVMARRGLPYRDLPAGDQTLVSAR